MSVTLRASALWAKPSLVSPTPTLPVRPRERPSSFMAPHLTGAEIDHLRKLCGEEHKTVTQAWALLCRRRATRGMGALEGPVRQTYALLK